MKSRKQSATFRCVTVIVSALLVVASLSMSGCTFLSLLPSMDKPSEPGPTVIPDHTDKNSPPESEGTGNVTPTLPIYYDPLTGLGTDMDLSALRPVAFCLGTGGNIGDVKVLIEAPVEDGSTRLLGVTNTYASMSTVGGIRDTRPYLLTFASLFSAVSVHAGCLGTASVSIPAIDYTDSGMGTVFYKNPSFAAPGDLFTSGTRLVGAIESFEKRGAALPYTLVPYGDEYRPIGATARSVILPFSSNQITQFTYDEGHGGYLFRQSGPSCIEGASTSLVFDNLLLLVCESSIYNKVSGTELDLNLTAGTGYYLTKGMAARVLWSSKPDGSLLLLDENGSEIALNRGRTYIGLIDIRNAPTVMIVE